MFAHRIMGKPETFIPLLEKDALVAKLKTILPAANVLSVDEDMKPYETDGLSVYRQIPLIVALPETEEQVQQVLKLCHASNVPVVARGQGTGLSGGALPHEQGVLLSMTKFMRILSIDPIARLARLQPGVRNLAISEAVAPYGLYYAPDPSSQIACSIGGNVAENSGGVHCLKYGLTVHNIHKIRAVTIEGELLEIGSDGLDAAGYDLLALLTGSEGMLAVTTEVTVKLLPKPQRAQAILAAFDDVEKAGAAVGNIISGGIIPAGLEMMDKPAIRAAEDYIHANYPRDAEAILLCESDGTNEEVADEMARMKEILEQSGAIEVRFSQDEAQRLKFWAGRKAAFPAVGRISPDYYCIDGTIPRKTLPFVLRQIYKLTDAAGLAVANVFHAGDGNLHPLILFDSAKEGDLQKTEKLASDILELCVEVGGTITGEHGVGIEKINQMCTQFTKHERETFHSIKAAFDEKGLLNPGKAVPSLHRCAEYGRMHVHEGKTKFPDIPRF